MSRKKAQGEMLEPSAPREEAIAVTIYGRTYHLRGNEDSDYLTHLATLVDRKMREVAEATATADTLKVAILACLNLADEYLQARRAGTSTSNVETERRLARMIGLLDEALAG